MHVLCSLLYIIARARVALMIGNNEISNNLFKKWVYLSRTALPARFQLLHVITFTEEIRRHFD